ncbi:hypothetical protein BBIA_2185 [Bifidobacterium biavatii DSM 23969]|uniref:Uncharacterized protein n=1 Tax=Bifidobacterium biavatii DSM 23969 TaxID=1437608 RepID=A0A086ZU52_9BIFI|nr:hypothetical protein BBIA_2185 [Bifidobacterium biavatii DSM 23969]
MRRMNKDDVREWTPGESLERVDFGNGVSGMDKRMPETMSDHGLARLMWLCAAALANGGPRLTVSPSDYRIDGIPQVGYFNVNTENGSSGPYRFDDAWLYINGIEKGYKLASRTDHRSGLYETLRTVLNGMSGLSSQRHENTTGYGPLMRYSIVSDGSNESGNGVRNRNNTSGFMHSTDSTYTRLAPVTVTRRTAPRTHSASLNGVLSKSARRIRVCSLRLAAWSRKASTWLSNSLISSRRSSSRALAALCSTTQPVTVTANVKRNPASSTPCSAIQSIPNSLTDGGAR